MFLILSSTHMTAMIWVQFREMKPEPNHGFYLLKPTWNHMWSGSGPGPVKPETKSSLPAALLSLLPWDLKSRSLLQSLPSFLLAGLLHCLTHVVPMPKVLGSRFPILWNAALIK